MTVKELRKALQKAEIKGYKDVPIKIWWDKYHFSPDSYDIDSVTTDFAHDGTLADVIWLELT